MQPNILYAEDEKALRMTPGDRLRNEGYNVDFAADGDDGLRKATGLPFDLIILDLADKLAMSGPEFDTTHLGDRGAEFFGRMVADELLKAVQELRPYIKP